ncbi:MAG: hypothetical protein HZA49_05845 [Planctomycetes bacterium]|nr:hypothetical protein [Planctomycetota bacterium]
MTVVLSVILVLPYWSVILTVTVVQLVPAVMGSLGAATQVNETAVLGVISNGSESAV